MTTTCGKVKAFGPYDVREVIGRGGSATVYKVCHRETGAIAALKAGPGLLDLDTAALQRFKREFTAIRQLRHPNLVRALSLGDEDGVPYIVMELVAGENLENVLKRNGPLPVAWVAEMFPQLAQGLAYLHANHILHRDIKPGNIFIDAGNQAKLGDFGLLKTLDDDLHLTRSRQGMGTMEYGAPEQFEDAKRVDRRCDIYSLAASLYTALTGKFPFGSGGHLQIMQRKSLNQFVPLGLLFRALDPAIDRLVTRCLDSDPAQRPSDCAEVLGLLREWSLKPAPAAPDLPRIKPRGGPERRVTLRFAVDLTATFVPFHQNMRGRWQATILDFSAGGIRLQTPRAVAVNSVLHVALGTTTSHLVLVRWVKPGKGESHIAGCSFVRPLARGEVEAICRQQQAKVG